MRRLFAALAIPTAGIAAAALIPAGSGALFAADEKFDGKVAGVSKAATVYVLCPVIGQPTGTVKAGQNWGVAAGTHGQMGDFGGSITATFAANPTNGTTFTAFGTAAIPTTNIVPCSGFGAVTFTPNDFGQDKKSTEVGVHFVGVAS